MTAGETTQRRTVAALGLLLAVAVAAVFAAGLNGAWIYDDFPAIVDNPTLRSMATAWRPPGGGLPVSGRPVVNASLALNHGWSGTEPWVYHACNIAIHAGAALLLFGIVRRTLQRVALPANAAVNALLVALLWAVHPLQTAAVTYVVQRAESLMGLFFLGTLYAHVRGTEPGAARGWLTVSWAACALGMATKEVMAVVPLIVLLYDRCAGAGSLALALRLRWRYYVSLASTWFILAALVATNATRGGTAAPTAIRTWVAYVESQPGVWWRYLRTVFVPYPLVFDYGVDAVPYAAHAVVAGLSLAVVAALCGWAARRNRWAGFAGAGFFLLLAPTSLVPIVTEPVAEHRMYLPLSVAAAAAVLLAGRVVGRQLWPAALLGAAALAAVTVARERTYASAAEVWADALAHWPRNARAHFNLARILADAGKTSPAVAEYQAALAVRPTFASAHTNLSALLLRTGDIAGARRHGGQAVQGDPGLPEAHANFANALLADGDTETALREFAAAIALAPRRADLHTSYGTAFSRLDRLAEARREYETALRLEPASAETHFDLANTCARLGDFATAIKEYEATLRWDPKNARAAANLQRVRAWSVRRNRPTPP